MKSVKRKLIVLLGMTALSASSSAINIIKSGGWLETAYAEWQEVDGAKTYEVYYEKSGGEKTRIDSKLIRRYNGYLRADAVGLPEGDYHLTVSAIDANGNTMETAKTDRLNVRKNTREGFAFDGGNVPGAYNLDGTPKKGARILYVTDSNINNVECAVADKKGKETTYTGLGEILNAYSKGYDKTPLIIRIAGKLNAENFAGIKDGNYLNLQGSNNTDRSLENVTIEGIGNDATLYGFGITMKRTMNIEIRNIGIMLYGDDAISLDTDNRHIWMHNIDFFYGKPGKDADQVKGDGSIDIKYRSTDITISFNHFFDSGKVMGCGGATGEDENLRITYHHNWFDHADSRCPRLHFVTAHIYNNYYDGVAVYGMGNTSQSSAFVESNFFREVKRPMMISGQGTDKYDESKGTYTLKGTFSGQNGGMTKAFGNVFVNEKTKLKLVYQTDNATQFDAYITESRDEKVPETVKSVTGEWSYNNFDTDESMYAYTPDEAASVADIVCQLAGRNEGGDLKWTFSNDKDDEDHSVNTMLKMALTNYQSLFAGFADGGTSSIKTARANKVMKVFDILGNRRTAIGKGINIVTSEGHRMKIIK